MKYAQVGVLYEFDVRIRDIEEKLKGIGEHILSFNKKHYFWVYQDKLLEFDEKMKELGAEEVLNLNDETERQEDDINLFFMVVRN